MKQLGIALVAVSAMAIGSLSSAGPAVAAPAPNRSAADTVARLQAEGHHVQLNGSSNVPLSLCNVTGVHGLNTSNIDSSGGRIDEDLFSTVYVDVHCQE